MSDLSILSRDQIDSLSALNAVVESVMPKLKNLTVDSIINEANYLNSIESSIPEKQAFDLHLLMILGEGRQTVSEYYKGMTNGYNGVLEAARKILPNSHKITESIESFKAYVVSCLNEELMQLSPPSLMISPSEVGTALTGGALKPRKSGGIMSVLTDLFNACTEGGSFIGIVQFILDVLGVAGDFIFPGLGAAFDIINAIIYFIRGKWVLGIISLIAGIFMGSGDILKLAKSSAHLANPVIVKLASGQVTDAAAAVAKMGAKESGMVMRFIRSITSIIGGVLSNATSVLGQFFKNFGKVSGFIPGLGLLIKPIFEFLGRSLTNFGTKITVLCDAFKLMDTKIAKGTLSTLDGAMKNSDTVFKLSDDGRVLYAYSKEGKLITKVPSETLMKSDFVTMRYGKAGDNLPFNTAAEYAKYHKTVNKMAGPGYTKRIASWITLTLPRAVKLTPTRLAFFIGKQIYKIITGKEWTGTGGSGEWSREEIEGHGNGAFNDWIDRQIDAKRKETGAEYIPYLELDSKDKEAHDKILDYQNHYAKILGEPSIMDAVSDSYDKDKVDDEFNDFFSEIASKKVNSSADRVDHTVAKELDSTMRNSTSESISLSKPVNIKSFSQFIK